MDPEVDGKPWVWKTGCACFAGGGSEEGYASCAVQEERGAEGDRREVDSVLQHHRLDIQERGNEYRLPETMQMLLYLYQRDQ